MSPGTSLGIVIIGRNEGVRLVRCLKSARHATAALVYVDSGSTDDSVPNASQSGALVVRLDLSVPFTAARARNAGFEALLQAHPGIKYVQFVDGDCELIEGWLDAGLAFLEDRADGAIVCGRVRERFPERSIYNQLCDWEWEMPLGVVRSCGGNALARVRAFQAVGGFNPRLIAGEEPELCVRLRQSGWSIHSIGGDMVWHDAAMTRMSQWWKRSVRSGHAFAEGAWLHGDAPERHWKHETNRALLWGVWLPVALGVLGAAIGPAAWLGTAVYPAQVARLSRGRGGWRRAAFLVLGKFPEATGVLKYHLTRLRGAPAQLIEYK